MITDTTMERDQRAGVILGILAWNSARVEEIRAIGDWLEGNKL